MQIKSGAICPNRRPEWLRGPSNRGAVRGAVIAVALCLSAALPSRLEAQSGPAPRPAITSHTPWLPLSFEQSRERSETRFLARGRRGTLRLQKNAAALALDGKPQGNDASERTLRMTFAGANREPTMSGEEELPGKIYYASGNFKGPLAGRPTFERVRYSGLYRGIDAVFYGHDGELEFDFEVAPHARPDQIRLSLEGADRIAIEPSGDLALRVGGQDVRLKKPAIYQERDGVRTPVSGGYRLTRRRSDVQFELGQYDHSLPLVIDPTVSFATYFGGLGNEFTFQNGWLKANAAGDVYLFGNSSQSSTLPPHQTFTILAQPVVQECFLTKLAADGSATLYTVVFAGAQCFAMDISHDGKVHFFVGGSGAYLLGSLNESTMTVGPLQGSYAIDPAMHPFFSVFWIRADSSGNVYLLVVSNPGSNFVYEVQKVDPHGQLLGKVQLLVAPIVNNAASDSVQAFDIDNAGHAYVLGIVNTSGVITPTPNAFQSVMPVKQSPFKGTGFLQRVDTNTPNAFRIDYATFIGGTRSDNPSAVAFDPSSNGVVVAGTTNSPTFPGTPGSYAPSYDVFYNQDEAFVLKLNLSLPAAQQLVYGTFLTHDSTAYSLTILPGGLPAIGGNARDSALDDVPFPLVNSLYPGRFNYNSRPFLSVFSPDASALLFSTFLDPSASSQSFYPLLATNGSSSLYEAITSNVPGLGSGTAFQPNLAGGYDVFLRALDASDLVSGALGADVSLTAAATPNPVNAGGVLTYSATVKNLGLQPATGVKLDFPLPANVNFESAATGQGVCTTPAAGATGDVNCNLGSLAAGATVQLTISVRPQAAGLLAVTLTATSTSSDPSPANNAVNLSTTVNTSVGPVVVNVAEIVFVTDAVVVRPSAMILVSENIRTTDTPVLLPAPMISVNETIVVTDTPSAVPQQPGIVVPAGIAVVVNLVDAGGSPLPVQLTFPSVSQSGVALGSIVTPPPSPPSGFKFLGPVLDVTTTASYTGPITVCFLGSGFLPPDQLWHAGALIGSTVNSVTKVCALVTSLSPFAVVRPSYEIRLLYDPQVAKKSGSAYPIKIQLSDINGNNLSSASIVVHAVGVTPVSSNVPAALDDTGNANPDADFRYDPFLAGYIFNLSTNGYATGTYTLDFIAGQDPVKHSVAFAVK
jgi:uncharacterized repeat protein (TIGR01451 family)